MQYCVAEGDPQKSVLFLLVYSEGFPNLQYGWTMLDKEQATSTWHLFYLQRVISVTIIPGCLNSTGFRFLQCLAAFQQLTVHIGYTF